MGKFLHCADVHLDSPLQGIRFSGERADQIKNATREALKNVVEVAMEEEVDFLIIAGDIYDTGVKSYDTARYFHKQMARLNDAGIFAYLIYGNHDAVSKHDTTVPLPPKVRSFRTASAETVVNEDCVVALHGQSFIESAQPNNLALTYPPREKDYFNIGLLHTSMGGDSSHGTYAPCSLDDLRQKDYDYWALGHVHTRAVLSETPRIVYAGNTQARQFREAGEKTCEIVTFDHTGVTGSKTRSVDSIPWKSATVGLADTESESEQDDRIRKALRGVAGESPAVVRLSLEGRTKLHRELTQDAERLRQRVEALADEVADNRLWIERIEVGTSPWLDLETMARKPGPLGEVLRAVQSQPDAESLADCWSELSDKMPRELVAGADPACPGIGQMPALLLEAKAMLAARLAAAEETTL